MTRRNRKVFALLLLTAFTLAGCAENQIPDLTEEQVQAVGEYVAMTLKKYDMGNRSRLMDLSEYEGQWDVSDVEVPEKQEPGMSPVDDTPVVNVPQEEAPENTAYRLEEVLGLPEGCEITFMDNQVCSYYPEDDGSLYFSLNAVEGRKLLVLNFSVTNTSPDEQSLDLLSSDITYRITVNGDYTRRALTSMLDNDLSVYQGSLASGSSDQVVLIIEVEERVDENITSVSLSVKNGEKSCVSILF